MDLPLSVGALEQSGAQLGMNLHGRGDYRVAYVLSGKPGKRSSRHGHAHWRFFAPKLAAARLSVTRVV